MNYPVLKRFVYILLLIVAQTIGLYFVIRPEKPAVAADLPTNDQVNAKNAAVTQCRLDKGFPAMGYGFKVICIKRENVLWIR
jgi:hypothetical protein